MIEIKHKLISDLPLIEMFEKGKENKKIPTIIFYHGWESRKERVLEYGYCLARNGFRVLLPDAFDHGERKIDKKQFHDPLNFWTIVTNSVKELPIITKHYIATQKTNADRIGVAGLSMGGITTHAILTQYDWIKTAAVLMGTPSPITFTKFLLKNYKIENKTIYESLDQEVIEKHLAELEPMSLNLHADKIAKRPLYIWHGSDDPIVPMELTKSFIEEIKNKEYSKNIVFEVSEGIEHSVPQKIILHMTKHFLKYL